MKKKLIIIIVVILLILFVPIRFKHKDGGSVEYRSLTYRIFKWKILNSDGSYYESKNVYFFPNNFHEFEYYEPIFTPNVTIINTDEEEISIGSYEYHWSKTYNEETTYLIGDGSIEDVAFDNSLSVKSHDTLTFKTDYGIENVEYSLYNSNGSISEVYNGLSYDQMTNTLSLPNLSSGDYIVRFKLYNEDDYAFYAFRITVE